MGRGGSSPSLLGGALSQTWGKVSLMGKDKRSLCSTETMWKLSHSSSSLSYPCLVTTLFPYVHIFVCVYIYIYKGRGAWVCAEAMKGHQRCLLLGSQKYLVAVP